MTSEEIYKIPPDKAGRRRLPNGRTVTLGYNVAFIGDVELQDYITIGNNVTLHDGVKLGIGVAIGNYVTVRKGTSIGFYTTIGDHTDIGERVKIGENACVGENCDIRPVAVIGNNVHLFAGLRVPPEIVLNASPTQIVGTRHPVTIFSRDHIQIGCMSASLNWWIANRVSVGLRENYTVDQIDEYGRYIEFAAKILSVNQPIAV